MPQGHVLASATKLKAGDRVAILSPSFAAPGFAPAVHEQAMRRLIAETGLVPVEYPTTRRLGASAEDRAADLNAAFGDPTIRAILATIGGNDQITVIPHLDADLAAADPKIFMGYSDNTNLLNWLWSLGIAGYYGGSTQVHLGPGPQIDEVHLASLRAALFTGGELELMDPGESEDFGPDWLTPQALVEFGERERTEPWTWAGPEREVTGRTWGGCFEVIDQLAMADRLPSPDALEGTILILESSEEMPPASWVKRWVRALGERGILAAVEGVVVARPPVSSHEVMPPADERARLRSAQCDVVINEMSRYNDQAVVCVGVPFGHTRPQWIVPYGGTIHLDGQAHTVTADYS
ncbi:Muramoyltetrapeptide carboxypeptidase LdcA (peptidoglycan recycling) [Sanguibacter gelidistatuariae]|uniref:Muramoyltetrapeptide carboxypeptidase LdcA (Peptidoglycan recycling) n=1 Tax=Sanguibacter gelidistatuariae TaxID=1814289 RepID=A0A1G6HF30_9MICO|nr:S66 peptidase family protein [Sanguibacter gelidistatuariae]SDB92852.1 Muramoyltetrapeptide carboxypeptidase LdcA (peptidoglycan recycling) [Sanguibacter gelidistatuariae]